MVEKCECVDELQNLDSDDIPDPEINRQDQLPDTKSNPKFHTTSNERSESKFKWHYFVYVVIPKMNDSLEWLHNV